MKIIPYMFFICLSIYCKSQVIKCDTISKKRAQYVMVEIKSKDLYPVKMYAVFEKYDTEKFDYTDADRFIKSFYRYGLYTPYLEKGYRQMLSECYDVALMDKIFEKNQKAISNILTSLDKQVPQKINLKTGDVVYTKSVTVSGMFMSLKKDSKEIFTNSMEWDILDIDEIKDVVIPFDNFVLEKKRCR